MDIPEVIKVQLYEIAEEATKIENTLPDENYNAIIEHMGRQKELSEKFIAVVRRAEAEDVSLEEFLELYEVCCEEAVASYEAKNC